MKVIRLLILLVLFAGVSNDAKSQVKIEDIIGQIDLESLLGRGEILKVKKGFSPIFSLGNMQINTVGLFGEKLKGVAILGDILDKKGVSKIMGMYKTYKTGLVVYKVLSSAGTAVTIVSAIKGFSEEEKFDDATVKKMLYPALTSIATGVITKIVTKKASYKAVDIFNGVARKTLKDILSVGPASSNYGVGVYVQL